MLEQIYLKYILAIAMAIVGISSYSYFKLKKDNKIEQASEKAIGELIGVDLDLSPEYKK